MIEYKIKNRETGPTLFNMALYSLRIVFMGTPEFAVASLDALVKAGYNIAGVVTAPDKPAGRGMKMTESPIKKYAVENNLKILQPEKLKNPAFLETLKLLNADLQIVVAFRMLPEIVWNMPRMGTVNLHASLLPQYRGAAPINWAVINGEKQTGVTTFKLKHEIDTGNILLQQNIAIQENETAGEVHDKIKETGAQLLVKTVKGLADGTLREIAQENVKPEQRSGVHSLGPEQRSGVHSLGPEQSSGVHSPLKRAPKIFTETCKIDFTKTTREVHNLIRGLSPLPGAFTELNGKMLKIYRSERSDRSDRDGQTAQTGTETDGKTFLKFACADGYIYVKELQLEGKKKMFIEDFLRGYHFK